MSKNEFMKYKEYENSQSDGAGCISVFIIIPVVIIALSAMSAPTIGGMLLLLGIISLGS